MSDRRCSAKTKKGKPCKAQPLKDGDTCMAHADATTRETHGFIAKNGKQGRKPQPRLIDRLAEKVEADLDKWLAPLERAREAERGLVVGNGPKAHIELVPDIPTQLAATREVFDRLIGRPKQTTEVTGAEGGPIETVAMPTEKEWHEGVAAAVSEMAQSAPPAKAKAKAKVSANGHRNGSGS